MCKIVNIITGEDVYRGKAPGYEGLVALFAEAAYRTKGSVLYAAFETSVTQWFGQSQEEFSMLFLHNTEQILPDLPVIYGDISIVLGEFALVADDTGDNDA